MQLDLFGVEVVLSAQEGGPDNLIPHILDLPFGPVSKTEATNDNAFLSENGVTPNWMKRDTYEALVQSGRIAQIVEEVSFDDIASVSGVSGSKTTMKQHLVPLVLDRMNGMEIRALASKYDMTFSGVQHVLNRPAVRKFVSKLLAEYSRSLGDVRERILIHATEAVDVVVDIMRTGIKEETRQKSAFAVLRMAGYDNNVTTAVTINEQPLDKSIIESTNKLVDALRESATARTRGHDKYIEQSRHNRVVEEVGVVEAPLGLMKVAAS